MSDKPAVLLFTDWFLPGYRAGGPIRSATNLIAQLQDHYEFYVVTSDRDLGDIEPYSGLTTGQWILSGNVHLLYAPLQTLTFARIREIILELRPRVVYLNSMFSFRFTLRPLWVLSRLDMECNVILAPRGMLMRSALAIKPWKKKLFLALFRQWSYQKKIRFHATTVNEAEDIKKQIGESSRIDIVPNKPQLPAQLKRRNKNTGMVQVVFVSRIHPIKNLLPALHMINEAAGRSGSKILFDIYGLVEDEQYHQKCLEYAQNMNPGVNVQFKGARQHQELMTLLPEYHLFLLPTEGENFGHAIFEALSSGCMALITPHTPWKNLAGHDAGWNVELDNFEGFVEAILTVTRMDQTEFDHYSSAAYSFASEYASAVDYDHLYQQLFLPDAAQNNIRS